MNMPGLYALAVAMLFLTACMFHPALCAYPHAQPDAVVYSDDDGGF